MHIYLSKGTTLFAGRYTLIDVINTAGYCIVYRALDRVSDAEVYVHEFFPPQGCNRTTDTQAMAILREYANEVSASYKDFTEYVIRLKECRIPNGQQLIHAFKDYGTVFYTTAADDTHILSRFLSTRKALATTSVAATSPRSQSAAQALTPVDSRSQTQPQPQPRRCRETSEDAGRRNAILWLRILVCVIVGIIALVIYMTYFSHSPKVIPVKSGESFTVEVPTMVVLQISSTKL